MTSKYDQFLVFVIKYDSLDTLGSESFIEGDIEMKLITVKLFKSGLICYNPNSYIINETFHSFLALRGLL